MRGVWNWKRFGVVGAFSFISFISFCFLKFVFCDGFFLFIPLLGANGLAGRGVSYQKVLLISLWSLFINLGLFLMLLLSRLKNEVTCLSLCMFLIVGISSGFFPPVLHRLLPPL